MKRLLFVSLLCAVLAFTGIAPALAGNQGGISGPIPEVVAATINRPTPYLQLWGGNFMPLHVVFPVFADGDDPVGTAWFRITWCQGFVGYKINIPGIEDEADLKIFVGDEAVVDLDPISLAGRPAEGGLHAEGWITFADVASDFTLISNPSGMSYPSVMPLYSALMSGEARIAIADASGVSVSGSEK